MIPPVLRTHIPRRDPKCGRYYTNINWTYCWIEFCNFDLHLICILDHLRNLELLIAHFDLDFQHCGEGAAASRWNSWSHFNCAILHYLHSTRKWPFLHAPPSMISHTAISVMVCTIGHSKTSLHYLNSRFNPPNSGREGCARQLLAFDVQIMTILLFRLL